MARLGRTKGAAKDEKRSILSEHTASQMPAPANDDESLPLLTTSVSSNTSYSTSGSLHYELINKTPSTPPSSPPSCSLEEVGFSANILASRPCYCCVAYMESVGIKRVFWTNESGHWECSKVRDLVDTLDNSMENLGIGGGPTGNGVFVTKHEVLMLRRAMGQ